MAVRLSPTYQGKDTLTLRWSQALTNFLNETFGKLAYAVAGSTLNYYLKANGSGERASFGKLALSDTGIDFGSTTITATGKTTVSMSNEPSLVILISVAAALGSCSIGLDNGTSHYCVCLYKDASGVFQVVSSTAYSIFVKNHDASNQLVGTVLSKNASGYIISATETGSVSSVVLRVALP